MYLFTGMNPKRAINYSYHTEQKWGNAKREHSAINAKMLQTQGFAAFIGIKIIMFNALQP